MCAACSIIVIQIDVPARTAQYHDRHTHRLFPRRIYCVCATSQEARRVFYEPYINKY